MVTRKSGMASARTAGASQCGAASVTTGASRAPGGRCSPEINSTTVAVASAPGTAQRRATRSSTSQVASTGRMAAGCATAAWNGCTHRCSSTPASMALASAVGTLATARPSGRTSPQRASRMPVSRNAATATPNPPAGRVPAANNAAPGVDQAMVIGIR